MITFLSTTQSFIDQIDVKPKYKQIRNYIRNRRFLLGNINEIPTIKEFVEQLSYKDGETEHDQLFTFGCQIGN